MKTIMVKRDRAVSCRVQRHYFLKYLSRSTGYFAQTSNSMKQSHSWQADRSRASQKKIPPRFITAFTNDRQLSLYSARSIQSTPPHSKSWSYILTLFSRLRLGLPSCHFPSVLFTRTLSASLLSLIRATYLPHLILFDWFAPIIFGE
jgi:hypothetical protein